jgi:hypothetical protein
LDLSWCCFCCRFYRCRAARGLGLERLRAVEAAIAGDHGPCDTGRLPQALQARCGTSHIPVGLVRKRHDRLLRTTAILQAQ